MSDGPTRREAAKIIAAIPAAAPAALRALAATEPLMFGLVGCGLDWEKDGRDIYDSIALIFRYPEGRQLTVSSISTNRHLPLFRGERSESGEVVMGTEGAIELTFGTGEERSFAMWFYDPAAPKVSKTEAQKEFARAAGATLGSSNGGMRAMPVLLAADQFTGEESFVQRELKWARRWLYSKGIMVPEEDRHPVQEQLGGFLECCRERTRPKADLEAGLRASTAVLMANRAMDECRRVQAAEFGAPGQ